MSLRAMAGNPVGRVLRGAIFVAVIAIAVFLRFDRLGRPSYWLDEILGDQLTTRAAAEPLWKWVAGFEREHGPLYYATQLATRLAGRDEFSGRLAAALFGVATIALAWFAALALSRRRGTGAGVAPVACAFLLAISPLHVYYSREARPYALVMLLTTALLIVMLRSRSLVAICAVLVALLYTSAVAAPVTAAAAVGAGVAAATVREANQRRWYVATAALAVVTTAFFAVLYRGGPQALQAAAFPASGVSVVGEICRALTVSAFGAEIRGHATIAILVLAGLGIVAIATRDRTAAVIVTGMTILPALFAAASLWMAGHWFAIRYVSPSVVGFVLLAGFGIERIGEIVAIPMRRGARTLAATVALAICAAITAQLWSAARHDPFEKVDWRAIGRALERHARPGDVIAVADGWSDVSLRYYARSLLPGVRIGGVSSPHMAMIIAGTTPATWLVSDGAAGDNAVRQWACRLPLVLSTRLEAVRIHYSPSVRDFIRNNTTAEDLRAIAVALGPAGFAFNPGAGDDTLLDSGWGTAEGAGPAAFRWVIGREATIDVPRWGAHDRIVRLHAMPAAHHDLSQQRLTLKLNGDVIADRPMKDGWSDYAFEAPASKWHDGLNTITFAFARAIVPASIDPASRDTRELAACIDGIAVHDRGTPVPAVSTYSRTYAAFASDDLLEARGVERSDRTRFPHAHLDRTNVEGLLGRLAIDPAAAWPLLERDQLHVEDVVSTIAYGSGCEDDRAFLQRAFALMVERQPNSVEERDLLARLRGGATRVQIIRRITNADDFRARMLARSSR